MTGISIPDTFHISFPIEATVGAHIDPIQANVGAHIDPLRADVGADATVTLLGDSNRPVAAQIQLIGDPQRPVTAKVGLSVLLENLPVLTRDDVFRMLRRRIRLPFNFRFGVSVFPLNLFGVDALQVSLCGEPQLITDDYVPNAYERCEVECEPCER
jgi:hypothetical protein